jgi:hypothetical protein
MKPDHPHRIVVPFPSGGLFKRVREKSRELRSRFRPIRQRDNGYLVMVRQCPCLRCGMDPAGVAAHVRLSSAAFNKHNAKGAKPDDRWTLPLCRACHTDDPDSQHRIGEKAFWWIVGINPLLVAERLYQRRDDLVAMRAVVLYAMAEREFRAQVSTEGEDHE